MGKYCWITLLGTDEYINGVIGLYYNLKEVGSKYPLVVMCFKNLKQETIDRLQQLNIQIKFIERDTFGELSGHCGCCNNEITINKFQMFNFIEYDKICFLDADIVLFVNFDYVFKYNFPVAHNAFWGGASGGLFTIIPQKGKYEQIKREYGAVCSNDEQILNILYLSIYMKNCSIIYHDANLFHHRAGVPKYWDDFKLYTNEALEKFMKISPNALKRILWKGFKHKKKTD